MNGLEGIHRAKRLARRVRQAPLPAVDDMARIGEAFLDRHDGDVVAALGELAAAVIERGVLRLDDRDGR